MKSKAKKAHPYIPNSVPSTVEEMLQEIGAESIEEFYEDVPEELRLKRRMNLPEALTSEYALKRHVESILKKNQPCGPNLNFLGAGCYQHYVPAVCDEVNQRGEFLTAYEGGPYTDHGKYQALFEYTSMMAELLNMEVVNVPTYDGLQATATSLRMACRITGRREVILTRALGSDMVLKLKDFCKPNIDIRFVDFDLETGQMDLDMLGREVSSKTAAVYFGNPSYLGFVETQGEEIAGIAHGQGALCVVGVDPSSLGVMAPPAEYGADIVCGDIQPLGMHMHFGGGQGGFIATHDDERYVAEYPSRLFGITPTTVQGEYGFGDVAFERTHFAVREQGKEWVGTAAALWGITAGVYLALMGPQGMVDLGENVMSRCQYAMRQLNKIDGVTAPVFKAPHFKEFVVSFEGTGKSADEVNKGLLERRIFGGKSLSREFEELAGCALYCVTEVHTKQDIDRLADALGEVTR
jgi:glycine dehydrogenase subunit 1